MLVAVAVAGYAALGWVAGLVVLLVGVATLLARASRVRRALAPGVPCPWCGDMVPQYGAYSCRNCGARTLSWAWRCPLCGSEHGHVQCPSCSMSVPNPMLRGR
jgi:hypothetical protein